MTRKEVMIMKWEDVRLACPKQWVLIEAIDAYTSDNSERVLVNVAILEKFSSSTAAMRAYKAYHRENPNRELYVLHTDRKEPNIIEKKWFGVRSL